MKLINARSPYLTIPASLLFALLCSVFLGAEVIPAQKEEPLVLPAFKLKGVPVCSFGIGIVGSRDPQTRAILRLVISEVSPGSAADQHGLKEGDEILAINGEKVRGMDGEMKHGSRLFDLLVNQPSHQTINLEVVVRTVTNVTLPATKI